LRPDLHRMSSGFYMKETPAPAIGAQRVASTRDTGNNAPILHQRYRERPKEDYFKQLQKSQVSEDFTQARVWRPGGQALKMKSQKDADKALKSATRSTKRAVS
jgi:hypothetical protein